MTQPLVDQILKGIQERMRGARLIDWLHESPGIVVNEARAAADPQCKCFPIDGSLCFHAGIVGSLDESQKRAYCKEIVTEESPELKERVRKFREASDVCVKECEVLPKGTRLKCRLTCMSEELSKRGVEV